MAIVLAFAFKLIKIKIYFISLTYIKYKFFVYFKVIKYFTISLREYCRDFLISNILFYLFNYVQERIIKKIKD